MERYIPGIGYAAGGLMLKWDLLNDRIHHNELHLNVGDKVNVFINFENILYNLTIQKHLMSLVNFHKQKMVIELEAAILNLVSHYKMYFRKEKCIPKIYLYNTSLKSKHQQMSSYNKFYRDYYHNRYMENPDFRQMGEIIDDIIIPEIELILSYVPDCYFIQSDTFDGSLIPYVISTFSDSKNVIITSDIFDTLYFFNPNFITIYVKRRYSNMAVITEIDQAIRSIIKDESPFDLNIFNSELYYRLLLSLKGSKIRNIQSAKGFGYGKFLRILKDGIEKDIVLRDFESIDSILQLFPDKYKESIKSAFQCTSIETQSILLNDIDYEDIKSQIIDKTDVSSLESLNNKRFLEFPINLQGLL
jgi:hypothetical protein